MHELDRELRDPVYGFIRLSRAECDIVNSPHFQRLRDIKQLAMGHMVYPGATHTRFEHSLGCLHLADRLIQQLRSNSRDILESHYLINDGNFERARHVLRLAALLHDIGHPPFSHSGENLLPIAEDDGRFGTTGRVTHEDMTARIIRETEIGEKIRDFYRPYGIDPEDVVAVATVPTKARGKLATAYHLMLNEMLTGDLGADRVDYLLRDAYHSGLRVGQFDHERLLGEIALVRKPPAGLDTRDEAYGLGFGDGGWAVAEQMIAARYLMYTSLYFHKVKRIYEIHLSEFMGNFLAQSGGHLPSDLKQYCSLSDSTVIAAMNRAALDETDTGHRVALRFARREHQRLARELVLADNFRVVRSKPHEEGRRAPDKPRFEKFKFFVSNMFGKTVTFDEADHSATKMFTNHNMLVVLDGKTRYLDDISEIVRGMSSRIWRGRVYADREQYLR